ncbi:unnamed protein product [Pieris macdunnoughi]|uniref:Uncharacterized protein n=1 Tax=Pieris macdunnoughi TaxID=345717 RepID=A0A821SX15_9NEOP|nr:unnamed protein product [Pieris macdunnoughi]
MVNYCGLRQRHLKSLFAQIYLLLFRETSLSKGPIAIPNNKYLQRNDDKKLRGSFGGVSKKLLQCLVNNASRVALVFDRYFIPSIEDYEHSLRGTVDDKEFHISGPQQTKTAVITKDLKNIKFKEAVVKFLIDHWADQEMASIIGSKEIYLIYDLRYECFVTDNKVTRIINNELSCPDREEADTKISIYCLPIK